MVLGKEHVPETQLASLDLKSLENLGCSVPSLLSLPELCLEDGVCGDTVSLDEFFDLGDARWLVFVYNISVIYGWVCFIPDRGSSSPAH